MVLRKKQLTFPKKPPTIVQCKLSNSSTQYRPKHNFLSTGIFKSDIHVVLLFIIAF